MDQKVSKQGHVGMLLDLGCSEKLASDTPKPLKRRSVMSRTFAPPCSMSVTLPAADIFCSSCDSVSSDAKGNTCSQSHQHDPTITVRPCPHHQSMTRAKLE